MREVPTKQIRIRPVPKEAVDLDELVGALIDLARQLVAEQQPATRAPITPVPGMVVQRGA